MLSDDFRLLNSMCEIEVKGTESGCSYLPDQYATMVFRWALLLSESRYESLLARGWRRFGNWLFRPACAACRACQSLRVRIPEFRPSRSQRRVRTQNSELTVTIHSPSVTEEHLALHNDYHRDMHHRRQWPVRELTREQYTETFLDGDFSFSREFQYRHRGRLVGLGLVDMTPNAMSSIYFVHAPEYRDAALGTFSLLTELAEGRTTGRQWLYLGYYIRDCRSMNYKNRFRPHQILQEYVSDDEEPDWRSPVSPDQWHE